MPLKEGSGKFGRRFILSPSDKLFRKGCTYNISFFLSFFFFFFFFLYHLHCFHIIVVIIVVIVVAFVLLVGCAFWRVSILLYAGREFYFIMLNSCTDLGRRRLAAEVRMELFNWTKNFGICYGYCYCHCKQIQLNSVAITLPLFDWSTRVLRDFRLQPGSRLELRSSGSLRSE